MARYRVGNMYYSADEYEAYQKNKYGAVIATILSIITAIFCFHLVGKFDALHSEVLHFLKFLFVIVSPMIAWITAYKYREATVASAWLILLVVFLLILGKFVISFFWHIT